MVGEIRYNNKLVRISDRHIFIINDSCTPWEIERIYENRNVKRFIYVDQQWIYALKDRAIAYDNVLEREGGGSMSSGLYCYDFTKLLNGALEVHQLSTALVGANDFIDFDL